MLRLVGSTLALLALSASPAAADPAGPTNYRTALSTDHLGVARVEVFGGDSFLVLHVPEGHTAVVHGYEHDPDNGVVDNYLRFDADGTVWVNERSEARWLNEDRYAQAVVPSDIGADVPPSWVKVADGGSYSWHDHRIHWMSPDPPPTVDQSAGPQQVLVNPVPITVDGEPLEVVAQVTWNPPPSVLPWLALAVVAAVGGAVAGRRGAGGRAAAVTAAIAAGVVAAVGGAVGLPAGVPAQLAPLLLPLAGLVVLGAARLVSGRARDALLIAAGIPVLVGAIASAGSLSATLVPSELPVALVKASIALSGGLVLGAAAGFLAELFSQDLGLGLDVDDDPDEGHGMAAG